MSTITVDCDSGNDYNGRMGARISSIFVIGFGSLAGALLPVIAARSSRMNVPKMAFFIAKYFGSGVIIATAFIHLLAPASDALTSPCLSGPITEYDWAEGIALMTIFTMFFIELMASRFDIFGDHDHDHEVDVEYADPAMDIVRNNQAHVPHDHNNHSHTPEAGHSLSDLDISPSPYDNSPASGTLSSTTTPPILKKTKSSATVGTYPDPDLHKASVERIPHDGDVSYPPGGEDHLGHRRDHTEADFFAAQMTAIFILEFGVIFHSIFIGLTLAVAGAEFDVLYIVLVFHQTFEGLGLGSRLATTEWPKAKSYLPYVLATAYGFTTPIAIAIGLGVRTTFAPNSPRTSIINGVFDAISAGILIYTGLVELMAHEFMFNPEMRKSSIWVTIGAFSCMCLGAGLMALLGKWA